jgi:DNA repair exonuclease SbcCD ATPase subunit
MKKINNKIKGIVGMIAAMLVSATIFGQAVSADSITVLKQQKDALELGKQINERKLKLAKLENTVEQKTQDMQKAAEQAQKSANANAEAASNLSNDAQDKKLARKASKAASEAKSDSRHARIATDNLDDLKKDIESLKSKIASDESKLASMPATSSPLPVKE